MRHLLAFLLLTACTSTEPPSAGTLPRNDDGFPRKPIIIMAPANPGGGWDQTARIVQQVLTTERILPVASEVINRQGAGGTIGLAELVARREPHTMMVTGRVMLGAILTNHSAVTLKDTVPIALLLHEYEIIAVPADSRYRTLQDLIEDFKRDPAQISWGGGSAGGTDHILAAMLAQAADVDPKRINYVAYSGSGEAAVAVMGSNVTAGISGYGEWKQYVDSGKMRFLAVSSEKRIGDDPTPTIKEGGLDVSMSNWRAIVAPPGTDDETRAWLTEAMSRMRSSAAWQDIVRKNEWTDSFLTGSELDAFIEKETASDTKTLALIGLDGGDQAVAQYAAVGPWVVPILIAIGLLFSTVGALYERTGGSGLPLQSMDWKTLALACAVLVAYVLLLNPIGYLPTTIVFLFIIARLLGSRRIARDVIFSVVTSVLVYALFSFVLKIGLPPGVLG